jgi:hypothetical protein
MCHYILAVYKANHIIAVHAYKVAFKDLVAAGYYAYSHAPFKRLAVKRYNFAIKYTTALIDDFFQFLVRIAESDGVKQTFQTFAYTDVHPCAKQRQRRRP